MPQEITPRELAKLLASGQAIRLIDVREPWENQLAALPNSILIPLSELPVRFLEAVGDQPALLVIYCHHGIRSWSAAAFLEQKGHGDVRSLAGGIEAWSSEIDPSIPHY